MSAFTVGKFIGSIARVATDAAVGGYKLGFNAGYSAADAAIKGSSSVLTGIKQGYAAKDTALTREQFKAEFQRMRDAAVKAA